MELLKEVLVAVAVCQQESCEEGWESGLKCFDFS